MIFRCMQLYFGKGRDRVKRLLQERWEQWQNDISSWSKNGHAYPNLICAHTDNIIIACLGTDLGTFITN